VIARLTLASFYHFSGSTLDFFGKLKILPSSKPQRALVQPQRLVPQFTG
jgi:hypothetical protein